MKQGLENLDQLGVESVEGGAPPSKAAPKVTLSVPGMEGFGSTSLYHFGPDETAEEKMPPIPIKTTESEGKVVHDVELFGPVMYYPDYIPLISLLESADQNTTFNIRIASRGGSIDIGANIGSAIMKTRAKVVGIAVGPIYSIAMFLWSCCHFQRVKDGASFLFHMSSHGAHGNSTMIKDEAVRIIQYVCDYLLDVSLKKGHLTDDEFKTIRERSVDIVISTQSMRTRLKELPTYIPEAA